MECAAKGSGTPCAPGPPNRRCGLCGAVAYCSLSHQILHWDGHKEECARLEEQMKRADRLRDFPFTFSTEAEILGSGEQVTRCSFLLRKGLHQMGVWKSECSCRPPVASISNSWFSQLVASSVHDNRNLFLLENGILLCNTVSVLGLSKLSDDWNLPSTLCPCTEPQSRIITCLSSWKDYYQWRCLPLHSPVALLLHWPLTVYHSFQLAAVQGLIPEVSDKLHIHYLGPEKELLQLGVFGELRALFPGLQLHMELVGPAVPQFRDGQKINLSRYIQCTEECCQCKSSRTDSDGGESNYKASTVTLKFRKGFYHDRYEDIIKESHPQLIVAPNAGVAAACSWVSTIELIKKMGIPAIFTDFCEEAAHLAARCISTVTAQPLRLPIQMNPFRQPMVVEDSALYLPCYSNCFLFGM